VRIQFRLNVVDGRVLCPRTCTWQTVDHCALCAELARIEQREHERMVARRPQIAGGLSRTVERLIRA